MRRLTGNYTFTDLQRTLQGSFGMTWNEEKKVLTLRLFFARFELDLKREETCYFSIFLKHNLGNNVDFEKRVATFQLKQVERD